MGRAPAEVLRLMVGFNVVQPLLFGRVPSSFSLISTGPESASGHDHSLLDGEDEPRRFEMFTLETFELLLDIELRVSGNIANTTTQITVVFCIHSCNHIVYLLLSNISQNIL